MSILQWNIQGYRAKYEELTSLIAQFSPACILLQETMLGNLVPYSISQYHVHVFSQTGRPVPGDGLATLIRRGYPFIPIPLQTNLQAHAFRVGLSRLYSVCNIYIKPHEIVTSAQIIGLLRQLPPPYIVGGDFNAKHPLWGGDTVDHVGGVIEEVLISSDCVVLNSGASTHFHVQSGTYSAIDLSICSADVQLLLEWSVYGDLCSSDHYPIFLKDVPAAPVVREPRFQLHRANWALFEDHTFVADVPASLVEQSIDILVDSFNSLILQAAEATIPQSSGLGTKGTRY